MNKTTVTKLPKSKVSIRVEVPAEDFNNFFQKALEQFAKEAQVDGFRPGTAPKELVKSKVGAAKIMDRAATLAIEATFGAAAEENRLEPLGYPEVRILKLAEGNPLEYEATIAVYPEIKLGDYRQIAAGFELKEAIVTDEDIKRLKMEKERHEREHLRQDALAALAQATEAEVPEILTERETEKSMAQLKDRVLRMLAMDFEQYLKKTGKTESQVRQEVAKDNEAKIKNYLILEAIAKQEKIDAGDDEIAAAIKKEMDAEKDADGNSEAAAPAIDEQTKEYYRQTIKTEKVFEFLEGLFKKP